MKIGVCCSLDRASLALELGADYVEIGAVAFNGLETSWESNLFNRQGIETTNVFFPGTIKLFGEARTPYLDYAKRTVERASEVGVRVMVIGSGGSRTAPDGYDPIEAEREFCEMVGEIQQLALPYGITIAPEPLTRLETNVGNDLGRLALSLKKLGLSYTVDSFHVLKEWEFELGLDTAPVEGPSDAYWAEKIPHLPVHVHIGDLPRNAPRADDPMMRGFARRMKQLGYDARISLECNIGDYHDHLPQALEEIRKLFR